MLTALGPEDGAAGGGVFTGHPRVSDIDFWREEGWIQSRGLHSVVHESDRVEIVSTSDWLTRRRGGESVLTEVQRITVPVPSRGDRYVVDVEWKLTAGVDVTFGRQDYGGLAFRPARHRDQRRVKASPRARRPWQAISGRFGAGEASAAGVAIFVHPGNARYPNAWKVGDDGLINPAISALEPIELDAGESVTFRYRLLVHSGVGSRQRLEPEYRKWAAAAIKEDR